MAPSGMGIVRTTVDILSQDRSRRESLELVVDTGSLFTWVPTTLAASLEIPAEGVQRFRSIDGRLIERRIAEARLAWEDVAGTARIVLAEPGDVPVLGLTTLETLGLEVDPRARTLRKSDTLLALAIA